MNNNLDVAQEVIQQSLEYVISNGKSVGNFSVDFVEDCGASRHERVLTVSIGSVDGSFAKDFVMTIKEADE